jgi:hypothetical protein
LRASGRFGLTFRIRVLVLLEKKSNFREKMDPNKKRKRGDAGTPSKPEDENKR